MSGSNVPKSPRAPEISAAGDCRSVRRLCRLRRASSERNAGRIFCTERTEPEKKGICYENVQEETPGDARVETP